VSFKKKIGAVGVPKKIWNFLIFVFLFKKKGIWFYEFLLQTRFTAIPLPTTRPLTRANARVILRS